jgi:hypothetical protein
VKVVELSGPKKKGISEKKKLMSLKQTVRIRILEICTGV